MAAALASGLLLHAALPSASVSGLAWVALVPVWLVLIQGRKLAAFVSGAALCFVFYTAHFYWLFDIKGYTVLHHLFLGLYLAPLTGLMTLAVGFVAGRLGKTAALLAAPLLWVIYEYTRSNLGFLALPWGLLAHSQFQQPAMIQIASASGAFGVSFLIATTNSMSAAWLALAFRKLRRKPITGGALSSKGAVVITALVAVLFGANHWCARFEPQPSDPPPGVKVALAQGNIDQEKKWDPAHADEIMTVYTGLTREAARSRPDLVVWPETATPRSVSTDPRLALTVKQAAAAAGAPILLGSAQAQKFNVKDTTKARFHNSAFLFSPDPAGPGPQPYSKVRLLPFGEYLPHRDVIPWAWIGVPDVADYLPGSDYRVFTLAGVRFSAPICWENIFPDTVRRFVLNGAEFLVNITNEAWFGRTAAPYQFLSMSVFRAVENRRYVLRCCNTGVTCVIDPKGRIVSRLIDQERNDLFVRGVLTDTILPVRELSLYSRHGDWFVRLCAAFAALVLAACFFRRPGGAA